MALKLSIFFIVAVAFVAGNENEIQKPWPEKIKEHVKPFIDKFSEFPHGMGSGSFPSFPSSGSLTGPGFPEFFTGGPGSGTPSKRQASSYTFGEWMNQFGQGNKPISGNLPFKPPPPFGNLPFGNLPFGGSSGSNGHTEES